MIERLFGTRSERELKKMAGVVARVGELEAGMAARSDLALTGVTAELRARFDAGAPLDDLLPEAFAAVRETARRVLGLRHFDVQLMGGIALHAGRIAEMQTGEGKTLVATLPLYLNALTRRGAHLMTVNDYLARRDAEWMSQVYKRLAMSTGVVVPGMSDRDRWRAYRCDITYSTHAELGFDYLRDHTKSSIEACVQRELHYAVIDEVDSILIDEARTPLILSGPAEASEDLYRRALTAVCQLSRDVDFVVDEKTRTAALTDRGTERLEGLLGIGLYDAGNGAMLHHVTQSLRAHTLYKRGVDYLVENGKVVILDPSTGRKMPERRWSGGLHQAVESKEHVEVGADNRTVATISYQHYVRLYARLAGMTGTAMTDAPELAETYKLDVIVVPTNRPKARIDHPDRIYTTERGKFRAVLDEVEAMHAIGRPILLGTASVEKSEVLSAMLAARGLPHHVLNAKNHAREADIVAQAGRFGAITVCTNMAGRGTDVVLGGNAEALARTALAAAAPGTPEEILATGQRQCADERARVLAAGGLHVLGTERHKARRVDDQLRGRAGRQGDPGSSRFYLSFEDDLLRMFGGERAAAWLGIDEDTPVEHRSIDAHVKKAQTRVEGVHRDLRKNLLEYDDVVNRQRTAIYGLRRQLLGGRYRQQHPRVVASVTSDHWTIDTMADGWRPTISRMIDGFFESVAALSDAAMERRRRLGGLTHALYEAFGTIVDLSPVVDDRAACIERAARLCAESILEQRERIQDLAAGLLEQLVARCRDVGGWNVEQLRMEMRELFDHDPDLADLPDDSEEVSARLWKQLDAHLDRRKEAVGRLRIYRLARQFYLDEIDRHWTDHLTILENLREGITLRGYGRKDPKLEYHREGYELFEAMMRHIDRNVCTRLFRAQPAPPPR